MADAQPDHHREVQDLFDKIERESVDAYDIANTAAAQPLQKFVPIGKIEAYFRENSYDRTKRLLRAVFVQMRQPLPKMSQRSAAGDLRPTPRPQRQPSTLREQPTPAHFPVDSGMDDFYKRFCEEQWRYCAPELCETTSGDQFEEQSILPFISLHIIGGGGSSVVYKAVVQPQHDKLRSAHAGANSNHCYAVKTYRRRDARKSYDQESAAFRRITEAGTKTAPGIIQFYGCFEYRNSFSAILEYAEEGTLETFWEKHDCPSTGTDWIAYWESLFQVIHGLCWLHNHRLPLNGPDHAVSEQGWHQDLKPNNILVVATDRRPNYKGLSFRIADFELTHFKTIMEGDAEASTRGGLGTRTYGAPECWAPSSIQYMRPNLVKRNIDIWSLGCIYSEAAIWAVKNSAGLQQYRNKRCEAVKHIQGLSPNDVFHDTKNILPTVEEEHQKLGSIYGDRDFITGNVVYWMIGRMLKNNPEFRPKADELVDEGERAIKKARADLSSYEGQSRKNMPVRPATGPLEIKNNAPPSPPTPHRSLLNDNERFVSSPRGTFDQQDVAVVDDSASVVDMNHPKFPRSKGKSRSSGSASGTFHRERHSRGDSVQESDNTDVVQSPVSPPATRNGEMSPGTAQSPPPKRRKSMPYRSKDEATNWYNQKKNGNVIIPLTDQGLMNELKGRDHVFLIDDSRTMDKHWREVKSLSHLLMYIVKEMDPDGVDLYFLSAKESMRIKTSSKMEKEVERQKPGGRTSLGRLDDDLSAYRETLDQYARSFHAKRPRPRNLYILTDGVLEYGEEKQGQSTIKMLVESIQRAKLLRGHVGVQFISFGDDEEGIKRLQDLDRLNQVENLGMDVVDTEPSTGNILKMLFGAINEKFDDDVISPISSRNSAPLSP